MRRILVCTPAPDRPLAFVLLSDAFAKWLHEQRRLVNYQVVQVTRSPVAADGDDVVIADLRHWASTLDAHFPRNVGSAASNGIPIIAAYVQWHGERHPPNLPPALSNIRFHHSVLITKQSDLQSLAAAVESCIPSVQHTPVARLVARPVAVACSFDVFLCHNHQDKPFLRQIAQQLRARGLNPWLDEEQIRPGFSWQTALEEQIRNIRSAAIFIGQNGLGLWHHQEIRAFINEFVERSCPVIPVFLPGAAQQPSQLPPFLKGLHCVDFRVGVPDPFEQLVWGIVGTRS